MVRCGIWYAGIGLIHGQMLMGQAHEHMLMGQAHEQMFMALAYEHTPYVDVPNEAVRGS